MSFIEPSVYLIKDIIASIGYPGLAFLMALDATIIPVPSAAVMGFAGFLCYEGSFSLPLVIAAGAVGSMVGSMSMYAISYWGGRPFLSRYGRYLGINEERLRSAEAWFQRYGSYAVLLSQLLPIVRDLIPFPAGVAGMKAGRFALFSLLGSIPFCFILAYIGFASGPAWEPAIAFLDKYDVLLALAFLLAVVAYFGYRALARRT